MSTPELRVMTYNVRSLRDDVDALASIIRSRAPDVLLVQEAPRFLRWRSKRAAFAREAGLVVGTTDRPGGLCIMTSMRTEISDPGFALLPLGSGKHRRAMAFATVTTGGVTWRVGCTHLSTDAAERQAHLPAIAAAVAAQPDLPLVIGGDLNEDPGGPSYTALSSSLSDCFAAAGTGTGLTSPANGPRRRLDAIFADRAVTVVSCEVVEALDAASASDHLPVLAVLRQ
jgi:endonuclease/exonuclease/phosphatase family metal-dependent hydrolase